MTSIADAFDGFIIDLDGVVHIGWQALPGAVETLSELTRRGKGVVYLTNDPRYARETITERLRDLGVDVDPTAVVTSGWAAAVTVARDDAAVYVIGSPELRAEVQRAGARVLADDQAQWADRILVGGHSDFAYAELRHACQAGAHGAELYTTNRDATFPMPDGPWPATGAILAAVETALGVTATCVGKPEPGIFHVAQSHLRAENIAAIGDRIDTDIVGSHRAGLPAVLVRTHPQDTPQDGVGATHPDYVVSGLSGLLTSPVTP